jgi:hypothetical protein
MPKPPPVDSDKYRVSAHLPSSLLVWGKVKALGDHVLTAGATETLQIEVTLRRSLPEGHTIEAWTHFVSDIERPQITSHRAPAFVACSADGVRVTAFAHPEAKVHGPNTFFPYRRYAGVRLDEGVPANTRLVFTLRDVSMQTYEETLFNLRFAIVDEDDVVGYLGDAFYVIKGAGKAALRVIAPTRVETGERFTCKIVTIDRFGNKTGDPLVNLELEPALEGDEYDLLIGETTFDADRRYHVLHDLQFDREGVYYIRVQLRDNPTVQGVSNPIVVRDAWPERVYWGDIHQHTYFADGRGTPAANYEYAISTSRLDFCAVAPHEEATYGTGLLHVEGAPVQKGWEELQTAAESYNGDDLVTILGSEAGSLAPIAGHMNTYYLDLDNRPELERLGLTHENRSEVFPPDEDPMVLYQGYLEELERSEGEVLLLPHAHACGGPGKFDLPKRPEYQTNVEICSLHGVFEEFYRQWLKHGHFVGVHGSGDNHMTSTGNGNPGWHYPNTNGLAAAVAPERSRPAIWNAFKHRRTYAVTGNQRIYLDLSIDGAVMGAIVPIEAQGVAQGSARRINVEIAGTAPVMRVQLFKKNEVVRTYEPPLAAYRHLRLTWTDSWGSRRVDDSLTTGTISLDKGKIAVVDVLHAYHKTDSIASTGGREIGFRTNGYSGITRGAILEVDAPDDAVLSFTIRDTHLDETMLDDAVDIPLDRRHSDITRALAAPERARRPCFTREPHQPQFRLEADWVDPDWPKVVELDWQDDDTAPAYYYLRVEQIDGNIAWSSPIWFVDG